MLTVKKISGSFRDPSGHVYVGDGRIFRTVNSCFASDFEYVHSSGILGKLSNAGQLLPVTIVPDGTDLGVGIETDAKYILETTKLPFISYPYEWPFSALKAAALLHLEIHLSALEEGVTLSDASAYNIQFLGPRPIFIDHLSFRPYRKGEMWLGHRQFCEQFLNPLLLQSYFGLSHNAWYRGTQEGIPAHEINRLLRWRHFMNPNVCLHIVMPSFLQKTVQASVGGIQKEELGKASFPLASFQRMLQRLYKWIGKLQPQGAGKTVWQDYIKTHNYSPKEMSLKKQFVKNFANRIQPTLLWDLGCNSGEYSKVALQEGAGTAVGFDADHGALEAAFERACEEGLALQPVYLDMTNPAPNQGWRECERSGIQARASANGVLALACIHHLAISRNIPFGELLEWIVGLAPNGIIEFVPKNDPMVQKLLRLREDIFTDYSEENFLKTISQKATIVHSQCVSESGRLLIEYERFS